eukprot:gene9646-11828_t
METDGEYEDWNRLTLIPNYIRVKINEGFEFVELKNIDGYFLYRMIREVSTININQVRLQYDYEITNYTMSLDKFVVDYKDGFQLLEFSVFPTRPNVIFENRLKLNRFNCTSVIKARENSMVRMTKLVFGIDYGLNEDNNPIRIGYSKNISTFILNQNFGLGDDPSEKKTKMVINSYNGHQLLEVKNFTLTYQNELVFQVNQTTVNNSLFEINLTTNVKSFQFKDALVEFEKSFPFGVVSTVGTGIYQISKTFFIPEYSNNYTIFPFENYMEAIRTNSIVVSLQPSGIDQFHGYWDRNLNVFVIPFIVRKQSPPGYLKYKLEFGTTILDEFIYSEFGPKSQVYITTNFSDYLSPVITNINIVEPIIVGDILSTGWILEIKDEGYGFSHGNLEIKSDFNWNPINLRFDENNRISGSKEKGEYLVTFTANITNSKTQDYFISDIKLEQFEHNRPNMYRSHLMEYGPTLPKISVNLIPQSDTTPPTVDSFNITLPSSELTFDPTSNNRNFDVYFSIKDEESGPADIPPIVYLSSLYEEPIEFKSKVLFKNQTIYNYQSTIDVPYGFGFTNLSISIYGIIDKAMNLNGYSEYKLLQNFPSNQPFLTISRQFNGYFNTHATLDPDFQWLTDFESPSNDYSICSTSKLKSSKLSKSKIIAISVSSDTFEVSAPTNFRVFGTPIAPSSTPTTPTTTTVDKQYYKVSPELLEEVKQWEDKKEQYTERIKNILSSNTLKLETIFNEYLSEIKPILDQYHFEDEIKNDIIQKEISRFEDTKQKLFGIQNASISALNNQISMRKREINMHNKITLIQAIFRGWSARKKYKIMKNHIALRNKCALEIVETERKYVSCLDLIQSQFLVPLQTTKKDLLTSGEITSIFSNCTLLLGVHREMLESLEKKWENWSNQQSIAECFLTLSPYLKLYTQYINNFNHASSTLAEYKKDFLDLQIQPVQRIPRYKLLLTELLQHTPEIHKDYENIKLALKEIQNVASSINESKRNAEGMEKIVLIQSQLTKSFEIVQPFRRYIKEGPILFEKRGVLKERYLFLFNDALLLCKKKPNPIFDISPRYSPISLLKLSNCIILPTQDPENQNGFAVLGTEHLYFYTKTPVEQYEWLALLKEIVKELDQNQSTLRKEEEDNQPMVKEVNRDSINATSIINPNRQSVKFENNITNHSGSVGGRSSTDLSFSLGTSMSTSSINNSSNGPIVIEKNSRHSNELITSQRNSFESINSGGSPTTPPNSFSPISSPNLFSTQNMSQSLNTLSIQQQQSSQILQQQKNQLQQQLSQLQQQYDQILLKNQQLQQLQQQQQPIQKQQQLNLTIRELINIFNEINQLYGEIFNPAQRMEVMIGNYMQTAITLDQQSQLRINIEKISNTLQRISELKHRSLEILKQEQLSQQLQDVIVQGKDHIGAFNDWVRTTFPKGGVNEMISQQPRNLA